MIGIYMRISTNNQSIGRQEYKIKQYLKTRGINIKNCKIYSETVSGWSENRKKFKLLLKDMEYGILKEVIITESDRLYKIYQDMFLFKKISEERNIILTNLNEKIEDEFINDMFQTICYSLLSGLRKHDSEIITMLDYDFLKNLQIALDDFLINEKSNTNNN